MTYPKSINLQTLAHMTPMQTEILNLLEQKVSSLVRLVDEKTVADVRNEWSEVNPSPACPTVGL